MKLTLTPDVRARVIEAVPGAELDRAELIGEGWGSVAYRVPAPGGDWVLRFQHEATFRAADGYEREARLLSLLATAGLPVPRDVRVIRDERGAVIAAAHRLVEGEPLTRARLGRGVRRAALAATLGDVLTRLHAFPRTDALTAVVGELDLWHDRYAPLFAECREQLGPRSRAWLDATAAHFAAEGGMRGAARTLVHGDLAPEHLLVNARDATIGVIDFGDAMIADPAIDFAGLLRALGPRFTEQVLARYGGGIDPHFRRRARFYANVVPIFLVRYGHLFNDGRDRIDGLRQLAARAANSAREQRK